MKVIITGSTGMVGKGVLLECLDDSRIESVLLLNRSPIGITNSKIKEISLTDFLEIEKYQEQFKNYDACFHCMGVSSSGMSEQQYFDITFTLSEAIAKTMYNANPNMIFSYVSGIGTDSTEKGNVMWARVKGQTENMILKMGFKDAYVFRPGIILPDKGIKSKTKLYNILYTITRPIFPILKKMKSVTTTVKLGKAIINSGFYTLQVKHLEDKEINDLSNRN